MPSERRFASVSVPRKPWTFAAHRIVPSEWGMTDERFGKVSRHPERLVEPGTLLKTGTGLSRSASRGIHLCAMPHLHASTLWEASPLSDLTPGNLRPEAGLPQGRPLTRRQSDRLRSFGAHQYPAGPSGRDHCAGSWRDCANCSSTSTEGRPVSRLTTTIATVASMKPGSSS